MGAVLVRVEFLGYQTGLWCRDCRLGTGVRFWHTATIGGAMSLRATFACTECQGHDIDPAPADVDDDCGA